jgi:hypothetical protein
MKKIFLFAFLVIFAFGTGLTFIGCSSDDKNDIIQGRQEEVPIDLSPGFLEGAWETSVFDRKYIFILPDEIYMLQRSEEYGDFWKKGTFEILINIDPNDNYPDGEYVEYTVTSSYNQYTFNWSSQASQKGQLYNSWFKFASRSTDTTHP